MRRLILCAALVGGCTPIPPYDYGIEAPSAAGEPQVTVVFEDNLTWPYRVQSLEMALDGQTVFDQHMDRKTKIPPTRSVPSPPVQASTRWRFVP